MYANSIIKQARFGQSIKDSAIAGLGPGASGDGIWKFIRSLITRFQDTGIVKSLLSHLARGQIENKLFGTPANYLGALLHGTAYGDGTKPTSTAAADMTPGLDKYRNVLGSIDMKGWKVGDKQRDAAILSFNRQWEAPNSKVRDASHQYLKDNLFSTWDQPQSNPQP